MNIYQAALDLRIKFAHTGINLEAAECVKINTYFIHHDSLHTYLGARPQKSDEPIVVATELVLGGQDWDHLPLLADVSPEDISTGLAGIPEDQLEFLIEFYTDYFS